MYFSKGTIFKLVLPLVFVLSIVSGDVARADNTPPSPPTSTAVALNTVGSLPVVVLNLTQSPIDMNLNTNSAFYTNFYPMPFPLAAGLPGVYYAVMSNGNTATFSNITSPNAIPTTYSSYSLFPVVSGVTPNSPPASEAKSPALKGTAVTPVDNITFSNNYAWMSLFTIFPSWTTPAAFNNVQYVTVNNMKNLGAAANSYSIVSGYPNANAQKITTQGNFTTAKALNAAQPAMTSIGLSLLSNQNAAATYNINIVSGGTPLNATPAQNSNSILKAMQSAYYVVADCAAIEKKDSSGLSDYFAGVTATMEAIVTAGSTNNRSTNATILTDPGYPSPSKGINISATATFNDSNGESLVAAAGDSQSLMYEVQSTTNQTLPLLQQNAVFVTTWRQKPASYFSVNAADTLFVTVLNEGVYASNQVQQYINSNSASSAVGAARYTPTSEQAQDTLKILAILTALAKDHPQDIKTIIDMFGIHGKYEKIKNDPSAVKNLNIELKAIFERYKNEVPDIEKYLAKLAQK